MYVCLYIYIYAYIYIYMSYVIVVKGYSTLLPFLNLLLLPLENFPYPPPLTLSPLPSVSATPIPTLIWHSCYYHIPHSPSMSPSRPFHPTSSISPIHNSNHTVVSRRGPSTCFKILLWFGIINSQ